MENNEVIEGNKLIAEFMGAKKSYMWPDEVTYVFEIKPTSTSSNIWTLKGMHYNDDWGWIMPSVERIRELLYDNELYGICRQQWNLISVALQTVDIKCVYLMVIEFIKHYNKTTNLK